LQRLLAELVTGLTAPHDDDLDAAIGASLRRIARFLTVGRARIVVFRDDGRLDREWVVEGPALPAPSRARSAPLVIPLRSSGQTLGTLELGAPLSPHAAAQALLDGLRPVAALLATALERRQAAEMLRRSQEACRRGAEEVQDLAGRLLDAHERERRRVARELHDDITQRLAVVAIEADQLDQALGSGNQPFRSRLHQMRDRVIKLSEDVHAISRQLHPSILEDLGLADAVRSQCGLVSEREAIDVRADLSDIPEDVPNPTALCAYRVIQEALRNAVRHGHAQRAVVSLRQDRGVLLLRVRDTGCGFSQSGSGAATPGLGLRSMEERVRLLGGQLCVRSRLGTGTTVEARLPLEDRGQRAGVLLLARAETGVFPSRTA
jgi:signal transduction histidine kinase